MADLIGGRFWIVHHGLLVQGKTQIYQTTNRVIEANIQVTSSNLAWLLPSLREVERRGEWQRSEVKGSEKMEDYNHPSPRRHRHYLFQWLDASRPRWRNCEFPVNNFPPQEVIEGRIWLDSYETASVVGHSSETVTIGLTRSEEDVLYSESGAHELQPASKPRSDFSAASRPSPSQPSAKFLQRSVLNHL